MLLLAALICFSLGVLGQVDQNRFGEESFPDLDMATRRIIRQLKTIPTKETKPHIQELSIRTTIISRYAFTAVYCAMLNRHSAAAQGVFQFPVPVDAYVSNFTMIVGGRVYQSEVRPKEKIKKENDKQKNKESSDESPESEVEVFRMAVSIPGRNRALFLLTYEELLQRRLGRYQHVTSLRPLHLVSRLSLDVTIIDHALITHLEVLPLRNGRTNSATNSPSGSNAPKAAAAKPEPPVGTVIQQEDNICKITFSPNIVQQARIATNGILGDFVVRYDVYRDMGIGDIQVLNGHFVHYFAPKDLPVVPKNVVFVIDTSASMLGTKIRQTKEALFTILKDLRAGDRFNFVSFSNRIKVWQPNRLVPVTPLNVRDAKKFIFMLVPTGGTNIDGAIQTGSSLLREYLSGPDTSQNQNSVSLIIFLTDGRPTVGEVHSTAILGNTRLAVQEKFCIFTIGIGNDVDYRLLDRMALENCGMMRRINEEEDASAMLKGFYDEIGTPLLSNIRINYTEDSVEYVTQHLFTNYFNGSEIVIAGKLTNQSADSLHVLVTATNNDKSVILETDVPLRHRQSETQKHVKEAAAAIAASAKALGSEVRQSLGITLNSIAQDFVERVWGFLSIKEGLRSRLRSQTRKEREDHTQQATNLSLSYHFLTPLTSLVVEKPEVLDEGTMAQEPALQPSTDDTAPSANEVPEDLVEGTPQELAEKKPSSAPSNTKGKVERRPVKKSITISKTSVDGDPHFVVEVPLSKLTVCFNINGEPGHILRLVSDHEYSGVTVNGKLIGAPPPVGSHKQQRTYFSTITIVVDRPKRAYIEVAPKRVVLDGQDRMVLPCHSTVAVESGALSVAIVGKSNVTVSINGNITFVILLHQYKNPAPYQRDHLGFYIANSKGLSPNCHGLLGQFLYEVVGRAEHTEPGDVKLSAFLKVKDRSVPVTLKNRRIYGGTKNVDCWFARNNAAKLIDGQYEDYLMPHMFDTGAWPHSTNQA
ncbi:inter-alpha-trypsin inhibitor heavy chain H5 [Thalassophryne amazonica]|uniref:inter-alpha-trypsin inhibitor heavy chain H5 n=1 Tax=Thalassophryne amazonica TaxID=390379 RepID=UPI0014716DDD|nr:inter-alpha-trypsin inhibitor heavy chain H5 [Thalassophryne amazonica]